MILDNVSDDLFERLVRCEGADLDAPARDYPARDDEARFEPDADEEED